MCTKAAPCTVIAKALATGRPYVRLAGSLNEQVAINNRNVTIFAEADAKLTSATTGTVLRIDGTSQVAIHDLELGGGSGADGFGISAPGSAASITLNRVKIRGNQAGGVSIAGGALTVARSTITENPGGGMTIVNATFAIVGNVITGNGTDGGMDGGIVISTPASPGNRLEFNSFSGNRAMVGRGAALVCFAGAFTARNNILSGNGSAANVEQVGGSCMHAYSIVRPGTLPAGGTNSSADPLFRNPGAGDLHLQDGSPAQKAADPSADLRGLAELDIDGHARTAPADLGADEVP
jgi:Right handed beta helix region